MGLDFTDFASWHLSWHVVKVLIQQSWKLTWSQTTFQSKTKPLVQSLILLAEKLHSFKVQYSSLKTRDLRMIKLKFDFPNKETSWNRMLHQHWDTLSRRGTKITSKLAQKDNQSKKVVVWTKSRKKIHTTKVIFAVLSK